MKKLFLLLAWAGMLYSTSCSESYDDSTLAGRVDDLENRVARLEELCKQMNTNIASLQTLVSAAQAHDCITSVVPVESGGDVIGYTITFSQNGPITIYHGKAGIDGTDGKDGMDGAAGKDGIAPVVGVKQDTDGAYYWTLDGEWLTDETGAKIRTQGPNGNDGQDGASGADGKDGITPQLKIENDYWYVSYDEEKNWIRLGKATSDSGSNGPGDSMFRSVDTSHSDYVLFTLSDGTEIRVPKFGALTITFDEGREFLFSVNETKTLHYNVLGADPESQVVVKVEMLNADNAYTLRTEPSDMRTGIITIAADVPTTNQVIVSVSDGKQTIMVAIRVAAVFVDENTIIVVTPGTLASLLEGYDKTKITEFTVLGNINSDDIKTFAGFSNLAHLNLENSHIEELPDNAFYGRRALISINLPKTLKTIGAYAFYNCANLTDVIIHEGVTTISRYAFCDCSSLSGSLIIPEGVVMIDYNAFVNCSNLSGDLVIPASMTSIGKAAFKGCAGFTAVYCKAIVPPSIGDASTFSGATAKPLYVPIGSADAYQAADYWKYFSKTNEMEF